MEGTKPMQQDSTTGGGYRAVCTVEVTAKLYEADTPGRLIEGDTDDLAAARYAHEGMKCAQILYGLSMLAFLASHADAERAAANISHNFSMALENVAALSLDLSDHALMCVSELHQLYERKGGAE
ncbi:MAG: hypothetical protein ABW007_26650 [Chitinophagaceae bacterium]